MDKETLDKDTFAALKELSNIQADISKGRTLMSELKENEAAYLAQREKLVEKGIKGVYAKSEKIINDIGKNFTQLNAWHNEVAGFVGELGNMSQGMLTLKDSMTGYLEGENKAIEERTIELSQVEENLKQQALNLDIERQSFVKSRAEIRDAWRLLKDRQQTLKKGFEELATKRK